MQYRRAFTLIELLVVIAIIAILAAILFPVFAQARESARKTACLSNARQIGLASYLYAQDYDEAVLPWIVRTGQPRDSARRDANTWVHIILPYVKNGDAPRIDNLAPSRGLPPSGIFACPSFSTGRFLEAFNAPDCDGPAPPGMLPPRHYYAHYGISSDFGQYGACTQSDPYYHWFGTDPIFTGFTGILAMVLRPAETVFFTDGVTYLSNDGPPGFISDWLGCEAAEAHQRGGNYSFLDGHAKWFRGNSQRYLTQDTDGCWLAKFYAYDR